MEGEGGSRQEWNIEDGDFSVKYGICRFNAQ